MSESAFNRLKRDHLELLCELARIEDIFKTMPVGDTFISSEQPGHGPVTELAKAHLGDQRASEIWPQRAQVRELCKEFRLQLAYHFEYEFAVVFTGIVMAMPTKTVSQWVFSRVFEHGQILTSIDWLDGLLDILEPPANKRNLAVIERNFQNLRGVIMQHALEEDTKIDALLRNNPEIGKKIQQLKANSGQSKPAPASSSAPL